VTTQDTPKALFLAPDGNVYPDTMICSGILPAELGGMPCPFAKQGRIPKPQPLNAADPIGRGEYGKSVLTSALWFSVLKSNA
jgi:hypothetical protein